ncbi:MAG: hypothetical protein Q9220_003260 [cf. Caloplaca sp. 1 TL-2023]
MLSKLSVNEIEKLETEGMNLLSFGQNSHGQQRLKFLNQAWKLFTPYKDVYPGWRYPRPDIRHELQLAHMELRNWSSALGHALKMYFYIEPVLFPLEWHPQRIVRTYVLLKIILEVAFHVSQGTDNELVKQLEKYALDWAAVVLGFTKEIEVAIPKGFGWDTSFAREFQDFQKNVSTQYFGWQAEWELERVKLRKIALELVN